MVLDRKEGSILEKPFRALFDYIEPGGQLVSNDTKVLPARLFGRKESGGSIEIFLVAPLSEARWTVLGRPLKKLKKGDRLIFSSSFRAEVIGELEGLRVLSFQGKRPFHLELAEHGSMPLPPYLGREAEESDKERYQTVYAKQPGSVAAPTAGLHFSEELIREGREKGVDFLNLTLHVGLGTFQPVRSPDIRQHRMHRESYSISRETAAELNRSEVKTRICIGTTTLRALESASSESGEIQAGAAETEIFIYPGYRFRFVKALLTNFHLPQSSLLMLVSAFAGHEFIKEAYAVAVEKNFRFFSYGDAMLIL